MITAIGPGTITELIQATKRSVFRVELLQSYSWSDEAHRLAEWRATGTVTPDSSAQWERLAAQVARGVSNTLLHVIDLPLTEYLRYEFAAYQADNLPAGQDVRIALRDSHPALAAQTEEFALYDDVLVWFRYNNETGVKLGWERDDDPASLESCTRFRDLAMVHSVPLIQFVDELQDEKE